MKRQTRTIFVRFFIFIAFSAVVYYFAVGKQNYYPEETINHIGENAIVEGEVAQISMAANGNIFIYLGNKYPNSKFTAVILSTEANQFPKALDLEGKRIRVYGMIENFNGSVQIIIRSKEQLKIIR